jgi:hypothetical protein
VRAATPGRAAAALRALRYLVAGLVFGVILVKSQVASWYRIQEMFRLESFYMYAVIGSAVVAATVTTWALRHLRGRSLAGEPLAHVDKGPVRPNHVLGGILFGLGWAATGACPGPILALMGAGLPAYALVFLAALAGTLAYGALQRRLPH